MMKLLCSNFNRVADGLMGVRQLRSGFPNGNTTFLSGKLESLCLHSSRRCSFSSFESFENARVLKVNLPASRYGPLPGSQWKTAFKPVNKAILEYKLFIPADFDFVKGGKLPGLGGGRGNTGGKVPNGKDGWSVRFMFMEHGEICAYLYYPAMKGRFGEQIYLKSGSTGFILPRAKWLKIGLEVQMNESGRENGWIRCYIDDELLLEKSGLLFRRSENLKIDHLLFSTFFGGADSSYAPLKDCFLLFKDFEVNAF